MNKIVVQLPADRDYAGRLEIQNAAGKRLAGPFRVCGRAADESAQENKNPGRNPLLPFGDTPFGEYQIVKIVPSGEGTPYGADEFGSAGIILMRPRLGDAALADANGRFGFFIQGGARTRSGLLRPTLDGSLRLSDYDQARFIKALQKAGGIDCFCLVISTAKLGAKVAVARVVGKPRRNTPASILLASSVIASSVTGVVRQAWVRTVFQGVSTAVTTGVAFVAEHVAAQNAGDYNPTGTGAADQLNDANQHGQDATVAPSDEQAHQDAGKVFDTDGSTPPAVDLSGKQGIVDPNAASGGMPPASDVGQAPGSPIDQQTPPSTEPATPSSTPVEQDLNQDNTAPTPAPTEEQPAAQDNTQPAESQTADEPDTQSANDNGQPHLKDSLPGTYLNDTTGEGNNNAAGIPGLPGINVNGERSESAGTGPSDTQLRPLNEIDNGVRASEDGGGTAPENQSPEPNAQPSSDDGMKDAVAEPPADSSASAIAPESGSAPAASPESESAPAASPESESAPAASPESESAPAPALQDQSAPATIAPSSGSALGTAAVGVGSAAVGAMVAHEIDNLTAPQANQSSVSQPGGQGIVGADENLKDAVAGSPAKQNNALSEADALSGQGATAGTQPIIDTPLKPKGVVIAPKTPPVGNLVTPPQLNNNPDVVNLRIYQAKLAQAQQAYSVAVAQYNLAKQSDPNANMAGVVSAQETVDSTKQMIQYETLQVQKAITQLSGPPASPSK